jgi:hypothetical protein
LRGLVREWLTSGDSSDTENLPGNESRPTLRDIFLIGFAGASTFAGAGAIKAFIDGAKLAFRGSQDTE